MNPIAVAELAPPALDHLAWAAERYDAATRAHLRRVGRSAGQIARALGVAPEDAMLLRRAARLHDVGKLDVPQSILLKRGALTAAERRRMERHTITGARMLAAGATPLLRLATRIAVSHHERWDGGGYPYGLAGETIPLAGRIVAVADVFDALTHARPYKPAWTVADALTEIADSRGTAFDPAVVDAFLTLGHDRLVSRVAGAA